MTGRTFQRLGNEDEVGLALGRTRALADVVRNPGMISDETICGVQSFHRIVFGDVSDAYQFLPSPSRISDNPDYRPNLQHGWITDIYYK